MPIQRQQHGRVSVLVIDRPTRANSIDLETALELSVALDQLSDDSNTRVVVLTGAGGRVFSAGMDLKAVAAGQAAEINGVSGGFAGVVRREFPKPLIAAIEGAAVGGGFEIVLACDLAVAAESARFSLPEVEHGLIAASGGLVRLPKRIPAALATEMLLTGAAIDAARALELGIVNRVVADGTALTIAIELAQTIAERDPGAVQASVTLSRQVARGTEAPAWDASARLAAALQTVSET